MARLIIPAFLSLFLLIFWFNSKDTFALVGTAFVATIISVIWYFRAEKFLINNAKSSAKKIAEEGRLPYGEEIIMQFEEDFFIDITDDIETKVKYRRIDKIAAGDSAAYLYIDYDRAFILPFSVFDDERQKVLFLNYIKYKKDSDNLKD